MWRPIQGQDRLRTPQLTIFFRQEGLANAAPKPKAAAAPGGALRLAPWGNIERMEAEGPVYFADDTQNGRGDHGVYTAADQTTVLTGNVVLVQGKNVSTGDKLVLHQDTNQAQLYSGSSSKRVRGVFYNDDAKAPATPRRAAAARQAEKARSPVNQPQRFDGAAFAHLGQRGPLRRHHRQDPSATEPVVKSVSLRLGRGRGGSACSAPTARARPPASI